MAERLISYTVQYGVYGAEVALLAFLAVRGQLKRLCALFSYLILLFLADGVGRPYVLYRYGVKSQQYAYFFWLSDVLLALGAFLLVCSFFRRSCTHEKSMWRFLRLFLVFVFILVFGISCLSLSRNYSHLYSAFIVEFSQNLYFTCLVLNTLLYLLLQQLECSDDEMGLLVCGMGIQFAGPAASLALFHLTAGQQAYARSLATFIMPMCTLGMLLTWSYAVTRMPKSADRVGIEARKKGLPAVEVAASKA